MIEFAFLRQRGIELMQQLSGEIWTDYNLHDPGVTMLEAICYAITDLSYRTDFPMADLLANAKGEIPLQQNAFFPRQAILSSNPVTVNDFRKFILDKMDHLHDVWLEPFMSSFSYGTMHGLYTMKVQVKKEWSKKTNDKEWAAELKREVRACFVSGRNLCEDLINNISILRPVSIRINAEVIITGEQPESLLAHIYRDLEAAINPPVKYYTEQELANKGYRVEDIYTGPLLKKGFVPDEELPPRKIFIDPAELMKAISQVPGVSYVRSLTIITPEGSTDRIPYMLKEGTFAYFEQGLSESPIRLMKDKYDVRIRESLFHDIWPRVEEAARRSAEPVVSPAAVSGIHRGQHRDVGSYQSLQHLFPVVYGIGNNGLGRNPTPERVASARQLKAYLLLFEQLLADYLAQLAGVAGFFSMDSVQTYFYQPLYSAPDIRHLLRAFTESGDPADEKRWEAFIKDGHNGYMQGLAAGSETYEVYCERKNAVLDHLLARFNERPSTYPVTLYTYLYGKSGRQKRLDEVIEWKSGLLKDMVKRGYFRVRGFDYLGKEEDTKGSFYKKMATLLYIRPAKVLSAAVTERTTVEPDTENKGLRGDHKLSFFLHGLDAGNYTISTDRGSRGGRLIVFRVPGENKEQIIGRYPDEAAAVTALNELIGQLREISILSEGFYIVEHVLLRPSVDSASFGFRFCETKKKVLLQHTRWTSFAEREKVLADILSAAEAAPPPAANPDDTGITEWGISRLGNRCRVQLSRHKEYGFMGDPIDLEQWLWKKTAPDFEHFRQQLLLFSEDKLRFYPRFEMLVKGKDENPIREEFFNFNMTVVFPGWPARFQDANFRAFAMDLFRMQTPAHIRLYFQWLNISRMKEFEHLHPHWMAAMKNQDQLEARRLWSDRIIHLLKRGIY